MGYNSHFTGKIAIRPPLTWAEIRTSPALRDLRLTLDEETADTDTGRTTTVHGTALAPVSTGQYSGYHIEEEAQAVIDAHPSHEFAGSITARPEDPDGTPWRYVVQGRTVVRQEPRMVWPGETEDLVV